MRSRLTISSILIGSSQKSQEVVKQPQTSICCFSRISMIVTLRIHCPIFHLFNENNKYFRLKTLQNNSQYLKTHKKSLTDERGTIGPKIKSGKRYVAGRNRTRVDDCIASISEKSDVLVCHRASNLFFFEILV